VRLQLIDIVLACSYIAYSLQPWIAVIVFITLASYIPLTILLTEVRARRRHSSDLPRAPPVASCCFDSSEVIFTNCLCLTPSQPT